MTRATKIVATLGPASADRATIEALVRACESGELPFKEAEASEPRRLWQAPVDVCTPGSRDRLKGWFAEMKPEGFDAYHAEMLRGRRVLVAEDNAINQQVVQGLLESLGYRCEVVGDGKLAVEAVDQAHAIAAQIAGVTPDRVTMHVMKTGGSAEIWGFDIDQHPRNAKLSSR